MCFPTVLAGVFCVMLALAVLTYRAYAAAARPSQALKTPPQNRRKRSRKAGVFLRYARPRSPHIPSVCCGCSAVASLENPTPKPPEKIREAGVSCVMFALAVLTYRAYAAAARPSQALSKTVRLHVLYIVFLTPIPTIYVLRKKTLWCVAPLFNGFTCLGCGDKAASNRVLLDVDEW